jgi:hypothetical protein
VIDDKLWKVCLTLAVYMNDDMCGQKWKGFYRSDNPQFQNVRVFKATCYEERADRHI